MSPDDLAAWIAHCTHAGIFSTRHPKRDAARALGITDDTLTKRLSGRAKIRRETAMACRAIASRANPWADADGITRGGATCPDEPARNRP